MESLTTNFAALGFYPAQVREKKIEITDGQHRVIFDPDIEEFEEVKIEDYEGKHAQEIRRATEGNAWFDDFKVVQFADRAIRDPFLFGIKGGKYYFVAFWDTDVWA